MTNVVCSPDGEEVHFKLIQRSSNGLYCIDVYLLLCGVKGKPSAACCCVMSRDIHGAKNPSKAM